CVASTCADPVQVPAGCIAQSFRDHAYLFCGNELDWGDARDACRRAQMDMTVIDDDAENAFVHRAGTTWIGASDAAREQAWRALEPSVSSLAAGPLVSYTDWAPDQPNNLVYCAGLV